MLKVNKLTKSKAKVNHLTYTSPPLQIYSRCILQPQPSVPYLLLHYIHFNGLTSIQPLFLLKG